MRLKHRTLQGHGIAFIIFWHENEVFQDSTLVFSNYMDRLLSSLSKVIRKKSCVVMMLEKALPKVWFTLRNPEEYNVSSHNRIAVVFGSRLSHREGSLILPAAELQCSLSFQSCNSSVFGSFCSCVKDNMWKSEEEEVWNMSYYLKRIINEIR